MDVHTRIRIWTEAEAQSQQLADEWMQWLERGCPSDQVRAI